MKNILVLFAQAADLRQLLRLSSQHAQGYRFYYEGFDLFQFPSNATLLWFDIYQFVGRLAEKYRSTKLDAIISTHEQFGALAASLLAERIGLQAMSTRALLNAQHKGLARQLLQRHVPAANVPFVTFPYTVKSADEIALPFPFYTKPVKAAFSVLARRVDSFAELQQHINFQPWETFIIKRLVRPFNDVVERLGASDINGHQMIAEQLIDGVQVNVDGFVEQGRIHVLGVIDAVMYPGTDAFLRWEYPSRLAKPFLDTIHRLTEAVVAALGLDHGLFNVEFRLDERTGSCKVIEVNPRMARQFSDIYEAVDGINLHALAIRLALGEPSDIARLQAAGGEYKFATSFVYRRFDGKPQHHFPGAAEIAALVDFDPKAQLITFEKRGGGLKRELRWLQSYRYALLNMAADSAAELTEKYRRASAILGFPTHP